MGFIANLFKSKPIKTVNSDILHKKVELIRYNKANKCEDFARDRSEGGSLWHVSKCLHPSDNDPEKTGIFETCSFVWQGYCPYNQINEDINDN